MGYNSELFGGSYFGQTTVHPLAAVMLGLAALLTILLPRVHATVPILALACFVSQAQRLVFFDLDFSFTRVMVVAGWLRVLLRQEYRGFAWRGLDAVVIAHAMVFVAIFTLQYASVQALISRGGSAFDLIGLYFLFRILLTSSADVIRVTRALVVLSVPVAAAFVIERVSGQNIFHVFGGVPQLTAVREGRLRVQGAFAHPIVAGCFWGGVLPLMVALFCRSSLDRIWSVIGVSAAVLMVVLTASATPLLSILVGAIGMCLYPLRKQMRLIRWSVLAILVGLHIVMIAPVWHLIARVSAVGGASGYHRFLLIDGFINHFDEWWLLGTRTTEHWGHFAFDVANQYVGQGVSGGIWTLLLFILSIALAFRNVGYGCSRAGNLSTGLMFWALGVAVAVHCASFIGLSYFGQVSMLWSMTLAMCCVSSPAGTVQRAAVGGTMGAATAPRKVKRVRRGAIRAPDAVHAG